MITPFEITWIAELVRDPPPEAFRAPAAAPRGCGVVRIEQQHAPPHSTQDQGGGEPGRAPPHYRDVEAGSLRLDGQERDALDPVLGAGVAGPIRDELVGVVSDLLDPQPRALDRLAVGVHLSGAADA